MWDSMNYNSVNPSSVKHFSKPSMNPSSTTKQNIWNSTYNPNRANGTNLGNYVNLAISNYVKKNGPSAAQKRNQSKELERHSKNTNKSAASYSSVNGSSVYMSRRGYRISDLNKSSENAKKADNVKGSKSPIQINYKVIANKNVKQKDLKIKLKQTDNSSEEKFGLDSKYLVSSIDKYQQEPQEDEKWDGHQQAA